jgi:orotate phosphoribosyltransferase
MIQLASPQAQAHAARLRDLLAALAYEEREVILASGRPSRFYIDCKQAVLTAEGHFLCGWLFNHLLAGEEVVAVGGMSVGADPLASATATLSYLGPRSLGAFYVRKEPKGHGTRAYLEGMKSLPEGSPVAIVEDVVTTGQSTLKAIERARAGGLVVRHVLALVDRLEGGREAIEGQAGGPLVTLFDRSDFRGEE